MTDYKYVQIELNVKQDEEELNWQIHAMVVTATIGIKEEHSVNNFLLVQT